ncbi:hypothetical protein RFI_08764 [Reticulomyxa filosa]|uniref:Uncharacterized protein n=1 Tax=Reticulomyxa filosa TaxID=46433 RepID=X6NR57_RETFI|nr:hypothetical protein RFI_08764 [Reticulomyxa filosa]|eukprot:ETO28368.1 hypothetical protein RFI_08764 [Reticulomyxa filosa]
MAKQTTTQNSLERETEPNQLSNTHFLTLKELPIPLSQSQCVLHKHELLICGGRNERACYSYHTLKNEYKLICQYPSDVQLFGHSVVKLVDSNSNNDKHNNTITLLSFGSTWGGLNKHTLVMKYVSVWSDDNNNDEMNQSKQFNQFNRSNQSNYYNRWIPFIDYHNHPIIIGRDGDRYNGARALIGGINNHLLFITYWRNNISVFDLNTFQFIKHDQLPTNDEILKWTSTRNEENKSKNKQYYQMLLFCEKTGLLIEYDEDNNTFQFHQLPVCKSIAPFNAYAYVCINDIILFFGGHGWDFDNDIVSKSVDKDCVAIWSEEDNDIHIIGVLTHMKTKVRVWDPSKLSKKEIRTLIEHWVRILKIKLGWIDDFDNIIFKYSKF